MIRETILAGAIGAVVATAAAPAGAATSAQPTAGSTLASARKMLATAERELSDARQTAATIRKQARSGAIDPEVLAALQPADESDFPTVSEMKSGELPPIPSGPQAGRRAVIATVIDPALSPGLEKVVANLTIRPPTETGTERNDVETAAAKQLAGRLASAGVIERGVSDRITEALSAPKSEP